MKKLIKKYFNALGIEINLKKNLWYSNPYEVMKRVNKSTKPLIIDIGACDGSTLYEMKKFFPESVYIGFEPFGESYEKLHSNCALFKDASCYNLAIADVCGELEFNVNSSFMTNSLLSSNETNSFIDSHIKRRYTQKVSAITFDQFATENKIDYIDILKMDVQGAELMVLQGSKKLLQNKSIHFIYTEVWFIEAYKNQPLYHEIAGFLKEYDYLPFGIYNIHYREDGHFLWGDAIFYSFPANK